MSELLNSGCSPEWRIDGLLSLSHGSALSSKDFEKSCKKFIASTLKDYLEKDKPILISQMKLWKHGIKVFGTLRNFLKWLNEPNFFFDGKSPKFMHNTLEGIKFIDDSLTGMQYGDNA